MNLDDISQAYENGYQQGKFEAWEWISCEDKLPEDGQLVLVSNSRRKIYCVNYKGIYDKDCHSWHWVGNTLAKVFYWMPCPTLPRKMTPPQGEKHENRRGD